MQSKKSSKQLSSDKEEEDESPVYTEEVPVCLKRERLIPLSSQSTSVAESRPYHYQDAWKSGRKREERAEDGMI